MKVSQYIAFLCIMFCVINLQSQTDTTTYSVQDILDMSIEDLINVKITAQKREELIEKVPLSVSYFSTHDIYLNDINDVSALELITPGLRVGQSGSDARLSIRGTRTNDIRIGSAQVVGVFVDGVYMPSTTQAMMQWIDAERIEVLRGPQGTLYGRNTFGGAVNVWSKKPTENFSAKANITFGNYNRKKVDGYVNLPLNKSLQLRIATLGELRDGYVENGYISGPSDDLKDEKQYFVRTSLRYNPTDRFEANLKLNRWERHVNGGGAFGYLILGSVIDKTSGQTDLNGEFVPGNPRNGTFGATPDEGPFKIYRDYPYTSDEVLTHAAIDLKYELDFMTIKSITAVNYFNIDQWSDGDLSDRPYAAEGTPSRSRDFFQEIQLSSNSTNPFQWLAGGYFQKSAFGKLDENYGAYIWDEIETAIDHDNDPSTPTMTTGIPSPGYEWATLSETDLVISSLFANANYSLNDNLRATVGLRYNSDNKQIRTWWLPMNWSPDIIEVNNQSKTWNHITWKGGIDYSLSNHSIIYGHVSNGFRAGGFNTAASPLPAYEEEIVTAYELGYKKAGEKTLPFLNIIAFYNRYREMQSQELVILPAGDAVLPVTSNAGDMDAYGLETEIIWLPMRNMKLRTTFAYLHAKFGNYIVSNPFELGDTPGLNDDGYINLNGGDIPLSPKYTASFQLSYRFKLTKGSSITPFVHSYLSSSYWTNDIMAPGTEQEAYTKSNFRLIWNSPSELWSVAAYVQNIENNAILNRTIVSSSGKANIWANYANPRTFGIEMILKLGTRKD